jgi:hypothetical protein
MLARMAGVTSGFYVPYHGGVWLIDEPKNIQEIHQRRSSIMSRLLDDEVYSRELSTGLKVSGLQAGVFKFDFSNLPNALMAHDVTEASHFPSLLQATAERVKIMNAFALCLHSSFIEIENRDMGSFWLTHEDLLHYGMGGVGGLDGREVGGPGMQRLSVMPTDQDSTETISRNVIDGAVDLLDEILGHDFENAGDLASLLNHAITSHKKHNFELAVVSAWTVCEALLNELWKMYYTGALTGTIRSNLPRERRDKLDGRDFTASIVSEVLNLSGVLDNEMHVALNLARSRRNKWLHGGRAPGFGDSGKSIDVARGMIDATLGINVNISTDIGASSL